MTLDRDTQSDTLVISQVGKDTPLQITRWSGKREFKTTSGVTQRITLPVDSKAIEITAVQDTFVNFGDVTVDATTVIADDASRLFLAGIQVIPVPLDPVTGLEYTHVAVIQDAVAGIFQVEKVS